MKEREGESSGAGEWERETRISISAAMSVKREWRGIKGEKRRDSERQDERM